MPKFNPQDYIRPNVSKTEITEIKNVFDMFDSNFSGVITVMELIEAMKAMAFDINNPDIFQMITDMEESEETGIDFNDFLDMMVMRLNEDKIDIEKMFELLDFDKTGYISEKNILKLGEELGERFTQDEIKGIVGKGDVDNDGKLTLKDYKEVMKMKTFSY